MATRSKEDLDRLERSLVETHRVLPTPSLGPEWAQRVMRDVRRDAAGITGKRAAWIELYVWRTAAAAAAFAVILTGSLFVYGGAEKGELTAVLSEELESAPALLE
jgi:hypothetical protein